MVGAAGAVEGRAGRRKGERDKDARSFYHLREREGEGKRKRKGRASPLPAVQPGKGNEPSPIRNYSRYCVGGEEGGREKKEKRRGGYRHRVEALDVPVGRKGVKRGRERMNRSSRALCGGWEQRGGKRKSWRGPSVHGRVWIGRKRADERRREPKLRDSFLRLSQRNAG